MAIQLTLHERERVAQLLASGASARKIGKELGRSHTTISRELRRNRAPDGYWPAQAHERSQVRRRQRPLTRKLDDPEVNQYVRRRLVKCWSPEQIAGRRRHEHPHDKKKCVSHETIYRWIRQSPHRSHWQQFLRRGGRRKDLEKRGKIPRRVEIAGRPEVVRERSRYGDWEGDTIVGRGRRSGLVSLLDRKSGYLLVGKVSRLKAAQVRQAMGRKMRLLPASLRHTLTLDNGKEFAEHEQLAKRTGLAIYFAQPYCSWQRGSNENANGLVRQYFPKGTDFSYVRHQHLQKIQDLLNHRPRERLNWRTPHEELFTQPSGASQS
jgi:transposase, IS30 family